MEFSVEKQKKLKELALADALRKISIHKSKENIYEVMHSSIVNTFENDFEKNITDWLLKVKYFENQMLEKKEVVAKKQEEEIPIEKINIQEDIKEQSEYLDNKEIKKYIDNAIELYADIVDITNDKRIVLKKEIAKIILPFALRNKLTKEKLEELLQQEIEKL